ncbi:LysR substrate-binding domain-containing protein [Aeromonas sanarellii]
MKKENIDLNLLKIFNCVMATGGISAAATHLGMTTAAVSQAMARLTRLIDEPLFLRQGRGINPTNRALSLHQEVQGPLYSIERALISSSAFDPQTSARKFRIASHPDIDAIVLPILIEHFSRIAPNCQIECLPRYLEEDSRQQALRQHSIDLIIATTFINEPGFYNEKLLDLELRSTCRINHPRIRGTLSFEQFFQEKHIGLDIRRNNEWAIESLASDALPSRMIAYESNSIFTALSLASRTDWICIASQWHLEQVHDMFNLQNLPVPWETDNCPIYINWHQPLERDAGLMWLVTQFRSLFSQLDRSQYP